MARGDHIYVERFQGVYSHHGLDRGDGTVVHLCADEGAGKLTSAVRCSKMVDFAQGAEVKVMRYGERLSGEEAVARAESLLGSSGYDLFSNNCEHFACWCVTGERLSEQVRAAGAGAGLLGTAALGPRAGVGLVAGVGETPALSAPNLMSGLRKVGGGNAVGGLAVLAGAGAVLGGGAVCLAFRDRSCLPDEERDARRAARAATVAGGAIGTVGVVYAVGRLGVPGYGAAGISSGLSALGAPLGGGMVAGMTVSVLAPALLAAALAVLLYALVRYIRPRRAPVCPNG